MKIFLILILIFLNYCSLFSQTEAYYFYPLKEGNVWVYSLYQTQWGYSIKIRKNVSATQIVNNHKYYKIDDYFYRVDSNSANVYSYYAGNGCIWSPNERMIDSLKSRLNDTAKTDCGSLNKRCLDTNLRSIFNVTRRSRHFVYFGGGRLYVKDIGIYDTYGGAGPNLFSETLLGCVINGVVYGDTSMLTGINQIGAEIPEKFDLSQNYPNPFNPVTKIKIQIPLLRGVSIGRSVLSKLTIYDALGKEVQILVNQQLQPGSYEIDWDASAYPSGVYYYKLEANSFTETKKMVLLK